VKCLNSIKHTQVSGEGAMYYLFKLMYTNTVITNCFMLYYSVFMSIDKIKYNNTLSRINTTPLQNKYTMSCSSIDVYKSRDGDFATT